MTGFTHNPEKADKLSMHGAYLASTNLGVHENRGKSSNGQVW